MCGIAGLVGPDPGRVRGMTETIRYRGPDAEGIFLEDGVGFGHRRLSIIDLSSASDQPFIDDVTGAVLVYNGEIYNFRELREGLERKGRRFRTTGDTEVILQGYLEEGVKFFSRLNGIFAFAIWEPAARRLALCRDPLGVKPLLYHRLEGGLAFASEAKALYGLLPSFALHPDGLAGYLRFHYTPGAQTIVDGILRFPPGQAWLLDDQGRIESRHHLDPSPHAVTGPMDAAALWKILEAAVQRQMIADVPVGSFLSGGIDSSIVTALASRHSRGPINTFSVGFDTGFDERGLAAEFAHSLGADHHELLVTGEEAVRDLGTISWHFDGPVGEGGCIPNYYVSRLAAKSVKVVLAGEGADELFGGYPWYRAQRRSEVLARFVPKMPRLARALSHAPRTVAAGANLLLREGELERYSVVMECFPPADLEAAGLPAMPLGSFPAGTETMVVDQRTLLRDCFLPKADLMTMAHGLEERVPFLDLQVVSAAGLVPLADKLGPPAKRILRDAAKGQVPVAIQNRAKRGYGTPMQAWEDAFHDKIERSLRSSLAVQHGLVNQHSWDLLVQGSRARPVQRLRPRWLLFALDEWVAELRRRNVL